MNAIAVRVKTAYETSKSMLLHMVDINSTKEHYSSMKAFPMYYFSEARGATALVNPQANIIVGGNTNNLLNKIIRVTTPQYGVVFISDKKDGEPRKP